MTHPALLNVLRQKAREKAEVIWQQARAEAERCRAEAARAIEAQRTQTAQEASAIAQRLANAATAEATAKARAIHAAAKIALADRLYKLAQETLALSRNGGYERLFAALAKELAARTWQRVRVNPADQGLAQTYFPDALIDCDETIVAGMEVEAEDGRIRIDNTLEKRLERAWPDVLPDMVRSIFQEHSDYRPSTSKSYGRVSH